MLQQLLTLNIFAFFLIFTRVGTALVLMPGFSAGYVPVRIRLAFGLLVSFSLMPAVVADMPSMPTKVPVLIFLMMGEFVVGAALGLVGRIILATLQVAGTLISLYSSLANALVQDAIAEQQSSTIAGFLATTGMVLVFATDMHHLMLRAVVDSYGLFEVGAPVLSGDLAELIVRKVAASFALGLQMASPFIVTALTYYLGLGLLGRLMPTFPVFFVGMPIQISIQISVLAIVLSSIMMVFMGYFSDGLGAFLAP